MGSDGRLILRLLLVSTVALVMILVPPIQTHAEGAGSFRKDAFRTIDETGLGHWLLQKQPAISFFLFGRTPDGIPANKASFSDPSSILLDAEGQLFIADRRNHRIYVVSRNGRIETYVGNGVPGFTEEEHSRTGTRVSFPEGMALDRADNLIFADAHNHRVRKVVTGGKVRTVAGSGVPGYSGDGGPATESSLNRPSDVCIAKDGSIIIADVNNHAIRKVRPDDNIETIAGNGVPGFSGDGGRSEEAQLNKPWGIACSPDGEILIADSRNHRIRKITSTGVIRTIAGTGRAGYSGDGGPGSEASFNSPQEVVLDDDGGMYVVDEHNHSIRYIDTVGIVRTVAGIGEKGETDVGATAAGGALNDPEDVWVSGPGRIMIADGDNQRVRIIDEEGRLWRVAGR